MCIIQNFFLYFNRSVELHGDDEAIVDDTMYNSATTSFDFYVNKTFQVNALDDDLLPNLIFTGFCLQINEEDPRPK